MSNNEDFTGAGLLSLGTSGLGGMVASSSWTSDSDEKEVAEDKHFGVGCLDDTDLGNPNMRLEGNSDRIFILYKSKNTTQSY